MEYQKLDDKIKTKSEKILKELNKEYETRLKEISEKFYDDEKNLPQKIGGMISGLGKTILTKYKVSMMKDIIESLESYNTEIVFTQKLYIHITKDIFGKSLTSKYHFTNKKNENIYEKYTKKYIEKYNEWKNDNIEIIEEIFGKTPTQEEEEKIKKEKKIFLRVGGKLQEFDLKITIRRQKELEKLKEQTKEQMKSVIGTIAI